MGTDLRGRDLGKGLDQIPSGLYRLRVTLQGQRLAETHEDLDYLKGLQDKIEQMKRDWRTKGGVLTQLTSSLVVED